VSAPRAAHLAEDTVSPLAEPGTRALAVVIDTVIPLVPYTLLVAVGVIARSGAVVRSAPWVALACFAVVLAIDLVLMARYGQTIGKRIAGVRVVRSTGERASLSRLFWARSVLPALLASIPIAGWLFGTLDSLAIFSRERRTIHDRIADTIVIDLRAPTGRATVEEVFR
jgi:uncharacterized RDD family membrane protein YckC